MSQTIASLQKKINIAGDLQTVVRTMKALAASSIGQYENALLSLTEYYHTIELGLGVCLGENALLSKKFMSQEKNEINIMNVIVFGSDQGLVGQFNEIIAEYALKKIKTYGEQIHVWTVGERIHASLASAAQPLKGTFSLPKSIKAITSLVGEILLKTVALDERIDNTAFHVIYNQKKSESIYRPVTKVLLPLDNTWKKKIMESAWPGKKVPELVGESNPTFARLLREYFFVSLFQACAESLTSENASRLAAMQRADKNIDELLEGLVDSSNHLRQSSIDEELFDVISGFEALSKKIIPKEHR